jgi:type IV secretory pathway VirB2 component (pilin)
MANPIRQTGLIALAVWSMAGNAYALTATPWRQGWQTALDLLQGDVGLILTCFGFAIAAGSFMFGGQNMDKGLKITLAVLCGISLITGAPWVAARFGIMSTGFMIP